MKLNRRSKQKGMSLLEVVVAMLVIGIALAGSIAMIQSSNRYGLSAAFTSIAQQQAQTIINQMRANNVARDTYLVYGATNKAANNEPQYNFETLYDNNLIAQNTSNFKSKKGAACPSPCDVKQAAKQMAINEMATWLTSLEQELPQGIGYVQKTPNENYMVYVMWKASEAKSDEEVKLKTYGIAVPFSI